MPTNDEIDFIAARLTQLTSLEKDAIDRAVKFLFLTNAGGAVTILSFLGAVESLRPQLAPKIALCFFVLGVILVGAYNALFFHHVDNLAIHWHRDVGLFYGDEIDWHTLQKDDRERSSRGLVWLYVTGYLSFGCFILGAAIGLLCSQF